MMELKDFKRCVCKADTCLKDYLDGYMFVNYFEIVMAVCDYFEKETGSLYMSDCAEATRLADEYCKEKGFEFDVNGDMLTEEDIKRETAEQAFMEKIEADVYWY